MADGANAWCELAPERRESLLSLLRARGETARNIARTWRTPPVTDGDEQAAAAADLSADEAEAAVQALEALVAQGGLSERCRKLEKTDAAKTAFIRQLLARGRGACERRPPTTPPVYDDVFFEGVAALDALGRGDSADLVVCAVKASGADLARETALAKLREKPAFPTSMFAAASADPAAHSLAAVEAERDAWRARFEALSLVLAEVWRCAHGNHVAPGEWIKDALTDLTEAVARVKGERP